MHLLLSERERIRASRVFRRLSKQQPLAWWKYVIYAYVHTHTHTDGLLYHLALYSLVGNGTAAVVDKHAPWPGVSVSINPLEMIISWNNSGDDWSYYVLSTASETASRQCLDENRTDFVSRLRSGTGIMIDSSNAVLQIEKSLVKRSVKSECVYTVCLVGVNEISVSHASGPVHVTTKTEDTRGQV